jgi:transcriptional regulator with XRE-family HTH domain
VASRIREIAKRKGLTMVTVADGSGVSRATVWAVLGGRRSATTDVLAKLAAALGVDPGELVRAPRPPRSTKASGETRARRGQ